MSILIRIFAALLRLYPRVFRDEFGEEMQRTFAESIADASSYGSRVLARVVAREISGLAHAIVREHLKRGPTGRNLLHVARSIVSSALLLSPIPIALLGIGWYITHLDDGLNVFRSITTVADLDGDSDLDVIVGRSRWEALSMSWTGIQLWFNQGGGHFARTEQDLPGGFAASAGDLDGDGDADLLVLDGYRITLLVNQGGVQKGQLGIFEYADVVRPSDVVLGHLDTGGSLVLGDLNGDGGADSFIAGCCYGSSDHTPTASDVEPSFSWAVMFKWDPRGRLARDVHRIRELDDLPVQAAALGDLDKDGDQDVWTAIGKPTLGGGNNPADRIFLNEGSGDLTDSGQRLDGGDSTSVAVGDVDGDGDLDALVGTRSGAIVWLNQGGAQGGTLGVFASSGQRIAAGEITAVFLSDLNGDARLDALLGSGEEATIWWNNGDSMFRRSDQRFFKSVRQGLAVGDWNGDGYPDVFAGALENEYSVWLNRGNGSFHRPDQP